MKRSLFILPILCSFAGCASQQLAFTTRSQIRTQNEIYTNQVLDNLSDVACDPSSLPYFSLLQSGVPSVGDTGTVTIGSLTFPPRTMIDELHRARGGDLGPLGAERAVGSNWTLSPISDSDRLKAMRSLYLWVVGRPIDVQEADTYLKRYVGADFSLAHVPKGWFMCGVRRDVPPDACRCFHRQGRYFWIEPGMEEHLTKVTLTMLAIATADPDNGPDKAATVTWEIDPELKTRSIKVTRTFEAEDDESTYIPERPINYGKSPAASKSENSDQADKPEPFASTNRGPASASNNSRPPSFIRRYNNYSNPGISPGLFSQPGRR